MRMAPDEIQENPFDFEVAYLGETVRFRRGVSKDFCVNERFDEVVAGRPDALTRVSALLLSEVGTVA